jgi:hypothetical protein
MIWLKYQNPPSATVARQFHELSLYERDEVTRETGRTLRHREYEHLMSKRLSQLVSIGADELADTDAYAFLRAWWTAKVRWYVVDDVTVEPDAGDFIPCRVEGGISPVEFVEGVTGLPSYTLTLIEKEAR